ncbi:hypothetical protein [Arthrobacter castelli]|uniref:hypothetical protein n=1 Tax=Arthrobacter castelli TaxID=271431 RepID=UPI00047E2AE9|nr:hypothetical protein [Arthrobacter castelli]
MSTSVQTHELLDVATVAKIVVGHQSSILRCVHKGRIPTHVIDHQYWTHRDDVANIRFHDAERQAAVDKAHANIPPLTQEQRRYIGGVLSGLGR